eukprot:g4647.t1
MVTAMKIQRFDGFRVRSPVNTGRIMRSHTLPIRSRSSLQTTAGFIGSTPNLIMVGSTALCLLAGRVGLAPSANKPASAGLNLAKVPSGMQSKDPAGFTGVDVLAHGTFGHIIGAGIILGLRSIGAL